MSLRTKFQFFFIILLVLSNAVIAFVLIDKQQSLVEKGFHQKTSAIALSISNDAKELALNNSVLAQYSIQNKLTQEKEISQAVLFNQNHVPLITYRTEKAPQLSISSYKTLFHQGTQIGHLYLVFSIEHSKKLMGELYSQLFKMLLLSLIIATVFAYFLDRFFSSRISQLNRALEETAETQGYSIRLPEGSKDEIGQAYQNFNKLVVNTERLTDTLIHQVNHDFLTHLYNRYYFNGKLEITLKNSHRDQTKAVCYIDLDRFKIINDTYGHAIGDEFLMLIANELKKSIEHEKGITLARVSGDEFMLLFENTDEHHLSRVLHDCLHHITQFSMPIHEQHLSVGVSIGAVMFKAPKNNMHTLITYADAACYRAKHSGGNSVAIFWEESNELQTEHQSLYWVQKIRQAIRQKELQVYLQPIVSADQFLNKKNAYEALVRLEEDGKVIAPFAFIKTLEKYGMMYELDIYMLAASLEKMEANKDWLQNIDHISINLSALTVNMPKAADNIFNIIFESTIPFNKICFEITETVALSNVNHAKKFITLLKQQGCKFSLDDFGTGMASFDYLYNLPVDYLKIDGSFIKDIYTDPIKSEMVKAMESIANLMDLETIAEFVENETIAEHLHEIGVSYHQGYLYSKPQPFDQIVQRYTEESSD